MQKIPVIVIIKAIIPAKAPFFERPIKDAAVATSADTIKDAIKG